MNELHPLWMIPILSSYAIGFYVFFRTASVWKGATSYGLSTILTVGCIYYYYGLI